MAELSEETRTLVRSRIENYGTLDPEAAAAAAIRVIAADFYIYCERNLWIKDKQGKMVPFVPNWAQRKLVDAVLEDLANGTPVRYIVLKARQMGLSTIIEALCYWWTTTHRNINSVIIAHEKKAAGNLYKMFRRYYDYTHPHFRQERKYNTKNDLTFDVSDDDKNSYAARGVASPGLASEIQTMVAKDGGGRSDTILFFHGSEVAFWDDSADVLSSALQAVPLLPKTFAFLESTANGVGGYFYDEWQFAKKGESRFKPFFFAWHEHPDYQLEGKIEVYDEEETELLEIFKTKGYPQEDWHKKLVWRREKKKEFRAEPEKFYQEYPKDDVEAFLASGRPVFDIRKLIHMETAALAAPTPKFAVLKEIKDPTKQLEESMSNGVIAEFSPIVAGLDPTPLKIWDMPLKDKRYTIGADVAEGLEKGDYSVIDVMQLDTLKTVARWRGHIDPDLLADELILLGKFYNHALIGCEVNNHGLSTIQTMRNKFYRNLYMRETSEEEQFQERTSRMGWRTDRKTKPLIIVDLAKAIREGDIIDLDIVFIRECMTYVRDDNGYTNAQDGMFDDTVMAKAINLQMANWNSYDLGEAKERIYKPSVKKYGNTNNTKNKNVTQRRKSRFQARKRK